MIKQMIVSLFIVSALLVDVADANEGLTATIIGSGSPIFNEKRAQSKQRHALYKNQL